MSTTPRQIQSVSNTELYNRWAKVYDTDGNILQALDDSLLPAILQNVFALLPTSSPLTITELGCGTGRNTLKLLSPSLAPRIAQINALDLSPSMLAIARERCTSLQESLSPTPTQTPTVTFHEFDALQPSLFPSIRALEGTADLVISTLVLEHLPLDVFFSTVKRLLREEGGYVVVTNMHAEMGRMSQAGFVDEEGRKVRGESFVYEVREVVEGAGRCGFEVVGGVDERGVRAEDVGPGRLLGERGQKWIGVRCWFGVVLSYRPAGCVVGR